MPLTREIIFLFPLGLGVPPSLQGAGVSVGVIPGFSYALTGSAVAFTSVTINAGDPVTWDNTNNAIHPLYVYDPTGVVCLVNNVVVSSQPGGQLVVNFPNPGTYPFHCRIHATGCVPNATTCSATSCGGLAANVVVLAAGAPKTPNPSPTNSPTNNPT